MKVEEIGQITEKLQNAEIQIDRLSKKEEMNGHLKVEYEAKVQMLQQEQADLKEQYRNTFDQLTSKEAELRKYEEKLTELQQSASMEEKRLKSANGKSELVISAQKKELDLLRQQTAESKTETQNARQELRQCQVENAVLEEKL